jgi:hypothetical protein
MDSAELGDGVVPVLEEDPPVQVLSPLVIDQVIGTAEVNRQPLDSKLGVVHELVEEEPPDRLGGT